MKKIANPRISRVVATGGPCGAKTTLARRVKEKMPGYGVLPLIVPEVATYFLSNGIEPVANIFTRAQFQELILKEQLHREALFEHYALRSGAERVLELFDRGILDPLGYCSRDVFDMILERRGMSTEDVFARYDAVLHMVTAADGAEEHYTLLNNEARTETPEEARRLDQKLIEAWNGHPHWRCVDNSTDLEGKIHRAMREICIVLGIPVPLEIERKFLVREPDISRFRVPLYEVNIEQVYLRSEKQEIERRVRKRFKDSAASYTETHKREIRPKVRSENEFPISAASYLSALAYERDSGFAVIKKKRFCFPYESQYFELDCFINPHPGLWILEIELTEERQEVKIPPFIKVIKEVTDDPQFKNRELARIKR
ncbi:MAG: AAA family ATPase [Parcubacteria group bacterium]|nr:AAA family ATPase [Parcubacteria group bacterium]